MGKSRTFQQRPVSAAPAARPVFSVPSRTFAVTPPGPEGTTTLEPGGGEGIRALTNSHAFCSSGLSSIVAVARQALKCFSG